MTPVKTTRISETFQESAIKATLEMFRQIYGRELSYVGCADKVVGVASQNLNAVINMIGEVAETHPAHARIGVASIERGRPRRDGGTPQYDHRFGQDQTVFGPGLFSILSHDDRERLRVHSLHQGENKCERVTLCQFVDGNDRFFLEIYLVET